MSCCGMAQGRGEGVPFISTANPTPRWKAADDAAWDDTSVSVVSWGADTYFVW